MIKYLAFLVRVQKTIDFFRFLTYNYINVNINDNVKRDNL